MYKKSIINPFELIFLSKLPSIKIVHLNYLIVHIQELDETAVLFST